MDPVTARLVERWAIVRRHKSSPAWEVTLVVELRPEKTVAPCRDIDWNACQDCWELSIVGEVKSRDYHGCGQCVDEVRDRLGFDPDFTRLCDLWERWHLNTMNAGTRAQRDYLRAQGYRGDYDGACALLKVAGLYVDGDYRYGTAWLAEPLPEDVLAEIRELCGRLTS